MLHKFVLFALLSVGITSLCYADVCPSVIDIQAGNYNEWYLLDTENAEPLSAEQEAAFRAHIKTFALAEWMRDAPDGSAHCYYNGKNHDGSYLGAYLAKDDLQPLGSNWNVINEDTMQCSIDLGSCLFQTS